MEKKRGAIEGPIRIPARSLLFLFNVFEFPIVSAKSLIFHPVLFSIPTAPTSLLILYKGLAKSARQQKAAIRAKSVGPVADETCGTDGKPTN